MLRQATTIHDKNIRTLNITPQSYSSNGFCIGVPLSTVPGASFAGINRRAGDLLSIRAKGMSADNTINGAGKCYVTLLVDQVLELREGSVAVLD